MTSVQYKLDLMENSYSAISIYFDAHSEDYFSRSHLDGNQIDGFFLEICRVSLALAWLDVDITNLVMGSFAWLFSVKHPPIGESAEREINYYELVVFSHFIYWIWKSFHLLFTFHPAVNRSVL